MLPKIKELRPGLAHYFCGKEKYYTRKSPNKQNRSIYFKHRYKIKIRLSNHYLHPRQEKENMIDIVILNKEIATINKKPIFYPQENKAKYFYKVCLEYAILEVHLYRMTKRKY